MSLAVTSGICITPSSRDPAMVRTKLLVVFLCFLAVLTFYIERVGFSIAYTHAASLAGLSQTTKGHVLSAFYYGYATSQIPGSWLAKKHGGGRVLACAFATWATISVLLPRDGSAVAVTCLLRLLSGVAQGVIIPSVHTVLALWLAPHERGTLTSLTTAGMYLGSALAYATLPTFAKHGGAGSVNRACGIAGLVWLALWVKVGLMSVGVDRRGTSGSAADVEKAAEGDSGGEHKSHLNGAGGGAGGGGEGGGGSETGGGNSSVVPWRALVTAPPVMAIALNNFTFHYSFYVVMNWLPTYFEQLLGIRLADLGAVGKVLPYLSMFVATVLGGVLGDKCITRLGMSVASSRKLVNSVGFALGAAALVGMPMADAPDSGLMFATLTLFFHGIARGGFSVNHMDVAPRYAGVVMGISNTCGTIAGIVGVSVTGMVLDAFGGGEHRSGWVAALVLCAALDVGGALVFAGVARGDRLFD